MSGTAVHVVRALRPRQWIKNLLVAAAPAAASTLDDASVLGRTVAAIAIFTAAAGATYLVNDAVDVVVDRAHPTKRLRPVAAGHLAPDVARISGLVLGAAALVAAWVVDRSFAVVVLIYLVVNAWYSAGMKKLPVIELAAVASGFVLRAVGGGTATDTPLSAWFLVVVSAASLFVVAGKRSAELHRTRGVGGRSVLRRYPVESLGWLRTATAAIAVVAYALWVFAQDGANPWLAGVSLIPFTAAFARYSAAIDGGQGEDPEDIFLGDRAFQLIALAWAASYGVAIYA